MAKEMIERAKVVLRGCLSYSVGGRRYLKDVPVIVKGSSKIEEFKNNGRFYITDLESKEVKKKLSSSSGKKKKKKSSKKKSSVKKKIKKR